MADRTEHRGEPVLRFATPEEFEVWLDAEHAASGGVWLQLAKKGCPEPTVTYAEALDVALCFGWIDGHKAALDGQYWLQRFSPRTARSRWSQINCAKVDALAAAGRMRAAGTHQVEAAKADGRWDAAYAGQRTATAPPDLQQALDADPEAAAAFVGLDSANRYAILYRVQEAKRPATRQRRIETFVAMLRVGDTLHPRPQRPTPP